MYVEPGGYYEHGLQLDQADRRLRGRPLEGEAHPRRRPRRRHGRLRRRRRRPRSAGSWRCSASTALFTPHDPVCSAKGAVVTNIAHIPQALTAVMALNGVEPDFAPKGDLSLKPWFGNNQGLVLPPELDLPVVEAMPPYDAQITRAAAAGGGRLHPSVDEGRLRRHGHGPDDAGHQPARRLDARRRARQPFEVEPVPRRAARARTAPTTMR